MLDNVAVPDIQPWFVELSLDPCNLPWIGDHSVLVAALSSFGRNRVAVNPRQRFGLAAGIGDKLLTIDDLELYEVYVDRDLRTRKREFHPFSKRKR